MKPDLRDIAIIDALPVHYTDKVILNVGCGKGRIDYILSDMGYRVYATDYIKYNSWNDIDLLTFHQADILDIKSFPIPFSPMVICSETLEHIEDYKTALANLLILAKVRLIITVPFELSFNNLAPPPKGHCNHWSDSQNKNRKFKDINEFKKLCAPYTVSITKIRTKPEDVKMRQWAYLVIVDKRQKYG